MSSSQTGPTSTTASSGNSRSRPLEILACGALAGPIREIVARRGWPAAAILLPAGLHNRLEQELARLVEEALLAEETAA